MDPTEAGERLSAIGERPDPEIDLGEAALLLGSFDRPRVSLNRYRDHLDGLVRDIGDAYGALSQDLAGRVAALNAVLVERHGYTGDSLTYDDFQNANLLRVIDRRKGLPVALGILYMATGQRLGWDVAGLNFPGHFLIRLVLKGERTIIDPFHRGQARAVHELRDMLKATAGAAAELHPMHYAAVGNRDVLLRLQNNIKLRLLQQNDFAAAQAVVDRMIFLAPALPELLRESALLNARLGNLQSAIARLEACLAAETNEAARHRTATLLQELRRRLH